MKSKKLLPLLALLVLVGLFAGIYTLTRPDVQAGSKTFTVEVTHKDGSRKEFSYRTDEEYLGLFLQEEGLLEGRQEQFGLYILAVDGEYALYEEDQTYWAFYQNGEYANQGVDLTPIEDGGAYAFVCTHG